MRSRAGVEECGVHVFSDVFGESSRLKGKCADIAGFKGLVILEFFRIVIEINRALEKYLDLLNAR